MFVQEILYILATVSVVQNLLMVFGIAHIWFDGLMCGSYVCLLNQLIHCRVQNYIDSTAVCQPLYLGKLLQPA